MKRYKIVQMVFLDFLTPQDQYTAKFTEGIVEWDERNTSWYISPSREKEETINGGDLIEKYIKDGRLVEIKEK
jgi:hypothetical protein